MTIPPIPKKLLPHSAKLVTKYSPDKWGNASENNTITLGHIRIEPSEKIITDKNGAKIQLSATLFYDRKNSFPAVNFALKDDFINGKNVDIQQVVFDGKIFSVKTIEAYYADSKMIHHYEIGLGE